MKKLITFIITLLLLLSLTGCNFNTQAQPDPQPSNDSSNQQQTAWQIKIIDGNICKLESENTTILIDKKDVKEVESFSEVKVSPDNSKICFLGRTIVPIGLYYSNIDGSQINKVAVAKNCSWSHNSQKISYNNHTTDVSPIDVWVYDIASQTNTNLTKEALNSNSVFRFYELPQWSEDNRKIISQFTVMDFNNPDSKITGTAEINVQTGKITDKY